MPNYGNVKDGRPFYQDEQAGFGALNDLAGNDIEITNVGRVLLADDGTPNARAFARSTGNYTFSAGNYVLQKQSTYTPIYPASIAPSIPGTFTINFIQTLPESTYDVQFTPAKNSNSQYASFQYSTITHSTTQLTIFTFVSGAAADLDGFSISIFYGT